MSRKQNKIDGSDIILSKIPILCCIYNSIRIKALLLYRRNIKDMGIKDLNRLKVVLVEKKKTNKWLAEQLGKDPATISKWCTNSAQPNLENLIEIARLLDVTVNDLIRLD